MPFVILISLMGCQSAEKKAEVELESTLSQFQSLESRLEKKCLVEVSLSSPTQAKYEQSYPEQATSISTSKTFIWTLSSPQTCDFKSVSDELTAWEENHLKILKGGFCTLLMGFQVMSPMSGVKWLELDRTYKDGVWTWIRPSQGVEDFKVTLSPLKVQVTSERGVAFEGDYDQSRGPYPRLVQIQRQSPQSGLKISNIQFQSFAKGKVASISPRELDKMDLFILDERINEFQFYGTAKVLRCE